MDELRHARERLLVNPTLWNVVTLAKALLSKTMRTPDANVAITCRFIGRESAAALRGEDVTDCIAVVKALELKEDAEQDHTVMVVLCKVREENPEDTDAELARYMRAAHSRFGKVMTPRSIRIFDFGRRNYDLSGVPAQILPDFDLSEITTL